MGAVAASRREVEYHERLAGPGLEIFGLVRDAGNFHLEVHLGRHSVRKRIATEACNGFLELGFFFLGLLHGFFAEDLHLLVVTFANRPEGVIRERNGKSRIAHLRRGFTNTDNEVVHIELGLELGTDAVELVFKLHTDKVGELLVAAGIGTKNHGLFCGGRSLHDRQGLHRRIHIGTELRLFTVERGGRGAIRADRFHTGTGVGVVVKTDAPQSILVDLQLEAGILVELEAVHNSLDNGIFIEFLAHLQRDHLEVLETELDAKHIGELLVVGGIRGNGLRSRSFFL